MDSMLVWAFAAMDVSTAAGTTPSATTTASTNVRCRLWLFMMHPPEPPGSPSVPVCNTSSVHVARKIGHRRIRRYGHVLVIERCHQIAPDFVSERGASHVA